MQLRLKDRASLRLLHGARRRRRTQDLVRARLCRWHSGGECLLPRPSAPAPARRWFAFATEAVMQLRLKDRASLRLLHGGARRRRTHRTMQLSSCDRTTKIWLCTKASDWSGLADLLPPRRPQLQFESCLGLLGRSAAVNQSWRGTPCHRQCCHLTVVLCITDSQNHHAKRRAWSRRSCLCERRTVDCVVAVVAMKGKICTWRSIEHDDCSDMMWGERMKGCLYFAPLHRH